MHMATNHHTQKPIILATTSYYSTYPVIVRERGTKHRPPVLLNYPHITALWETFQKFWDRFRRAFDESSPLPLSLMSVCCIETKRVAYSKKYHHHLTFLFLTPRSSFFLCEWAFVIPNYHMIARFWVWGASCSFGDLRLSGKLVTTLGVQ